MSIQMVASHALTTPEPRLRAAGLLWRASGTVLVFMPVAMAVAHRSSALVIGLSAVLALLAVALEGGWARLGGGLRAALSTPLALAALAFLAWGIVSLSWSRFPADSILALLEFWVPVASALILALILPGRVPRWSVWLFAGTTSLACLSILAELQTGLTLRQSLGMRPHPYIFNRSVLTILIGLVPLLAGLWALGARGRAVGAAVAALAVATAFRSESGAAAVAIPVAAGVAVFAYAAPRIALWLGGAAVVLVFAVAPFLGEIGDRAIPPSVHSQLADSHSRDRVDIWLSFGAAIRQQPWLGGGYGVSPHMRRTPVARKVPRELRRLLAVGHPHNAALQVWAELGAVGAMLGAAILLLILRALSRRPRGELAPMLALFAGVAAVSLVGHGAWQGWWPAAIGAAIFWFRFNRTNSEDAIS